MASILFRPQCVKQDATNPGTLNEAGSTCHMVVSLNINSTKYDDNRLKFQKYRKVPNWYYDDNRLTFQKYRKVYNWYGRYLMPVIWYGCAYMFIVDHIWSFGILL